MMKIILPDGQVVTGPGPGKRVLAFCSKCGVCFAADEPNDLRDVPVLCPTCEKQFTEHLGDRERNRMAKLRLRAFSDPEPDITINGIRLGIGQAMTVRVAIEALAASLSLNPLGDDEHGRAMTKGYMKRIQEIRVMIFGEQQRGAR